MTEKQRQEQLEATRRAMKAWLELPLEERTEDLKRAGILDREGRLSSRYGGSGEMTGPAEIVD